MMFRTVAVVFALAVLMLGLPVPAAQAQPFEGDPLAFGRIVQPVPVRSVRVGAAGTRDMNEPLSAFADTSPMRMAARSVGRLDVLYASNGNKVRHCTAVIVDEAFVLTSDLCLPVEGGIVAMTLVMGFDDGEMPSVAQVYTVDHRPIEIDRETGYALLHVFGAPSLRFGAVRFALRPVLGAQPMWMIGHPVAGPLRIARLGCAATDPAVTPDGRLGHRCDTLPGTSGAPLFDISGPIAVSALHRSGNGPEGDAVAVPIARIIEASPRIARIARDQLRTCQPGPGDDCLP
ncbi:serine protease [Mameliella sp. AT18]|uniref:trypsin-like serine peptidase n=1 Tax=Mameliella sp. AT18 TaxID=3028385 RepID=UPI001112F12E|nr:serine protease [Mameliella sp. AT18]MDD9729903.1 serine protease [Mameliella sp. AT18]